jgi:YD repeat-containing protein
LQRGTKLSFDQFGSQWSGLALLFDARPAGVRPASALELRNEVGGCCGHPKAQDDLGSTGSMQCRGLPAWAVNPVNLNVVVQDVPMWFDNPVGPQPEIKITYNSLSALNQLRPVGNKWMLNYGSYAMESPGGQPAGSVLVVMPEGRNDVYLPNGAGAYTSPSDVSNTLTKTGPYAFDVRFPDDSVYHYGVPAGMAGTSSLLLSIEDRFHSTITINHDSSGNITTVVDPEGHVWTFAYKGQGMISNITDQFGRASTFSYDASNNLVAQTDMGGTAYGYTYDANVYLTSIIKPAGTTTFYIEPADGVNNMSLGYASYRYPPPGGVMWENYRVTVTDPLNYKEEFYYNGGDTVGWHRDKVQYLEGGSTVDALTSPKTKYGFTLPTGSGGRSVISSVTYADGKSVTYSNFNAARLPLHVINENGKAMDFTYNAKGRVLTRTDFRNNGTTINYVTSYAYAANGFDLVQVTDARPVVVAVISYDANRNVASVSDALNRQAACTYNALGQVATVTQAVGTALERQNARLIVEWRRCLTS